jgi:hypothetical protein
MGWRHRHRNWLCFGALGSLFALPAFAQQSVIERTPDNNTALKIGIGVQFGGFLGGTAAGFVPEPITNYIGEGIELATDNTLKFTPPALARLANKQLDVNAPLVGGSGETCSYEFELQQYQAEHNNLFGFTWRVVPGERWAGFVRKKGFWGPLVADGEMDVFHLHSDVDVTLSGPGVSHDENVYPLTIRLPEGQHSFLWEANTMYSPITDTVIPAVLLAVGILSETKAAEPWLEFFTNKKVLNDIIANPANARFVDEAVAEGIRRGILRRLIRRLGTDFAVETATSEGASAFIDLFAPSFSFARNSFSQTVTVWDVHTPMIEATTPHVILEATDFGGTRMARAYDTLTNGLQYADACDSSLRLSHDAPNILPLSVDDTVHTINWSVTDVPAGVNPATYYKAGYDSSASTQQTYIVKDTQPPILVAPAGKVIVDAGPSIDPSGLDLGRPLVIDLADPIPSVTNDAPASFAVDSRINVTWTATDLSGNTISKPQWITAKSPGTNTPPTVAGVNVDTRTAETIDIRIDAVDLDLLPTSEGNSIVDPLSFRMVDYPDHGEFEAPLRPHFIEDFRLTPVGDTEIEGVRTSPLGANAAEFSALPDTDSRRSLLQARYCDNGLAIPVNFAYQPTYVHVADSGNYYIRDSYFECRALGAFLPLEHERISKWNEHRVLQRHFLLRELPRTTQSDIFSVDDDENIFWAVYGSLGNVLGFNKLDRNLTNVDRLIMAPIIFGNGRAWKNAHGDLRRNLLYVIDNLGIVVFDSRDFESSGGLLDFLDPANERDRAGVLTVDGSASFFPNVDCGLDTDEKFWMTTDASGNLYVAEACQHRIHKFSPSSINSQGDLQAGSYVGWMGKCTDNVPPWSACEVDKQISQGYACRDNRCERGSTAGSQPGQFNRPVHIATDPRGTLYVADTLNERVQRFGDDGTFGGQALSEGSGINTGPEPGFVLGNFGTPRAVAVNSDTLFIMQSAVAFDYFLHSFKTLPFHRIDANGNELDADSDGYADNSVLLKYTSDYNFPGDTGQIVANDSFRFKVNDGLVDSAIAEGVVTVSRNYRAPENLDVRCYAPAQPSRRVGCELDEDTDIIVEFIASDPDGIIGYDGLDTLSYSIDKNPKSGELSLVSADAAFARYLYTPEPDFYGTDRFRFAVTDNTTLRPNDEPVVETAQFELEVLPVPDAPVLEVDTTTMAGRGFPATLTASYSDVDRDPNEPDPILSVSWGDGIAEAQGDIVDLGNGEYDMTGPVLNPTSPGSGNIVGTHTFSATGAPPINVCLDSVDSPTPICVIVRQDVEDATRVTALSTANQPAPIVAELFTVTLEITNQAPEGWAGLEAPAVRSLTRLPEGLSLVSADSRCIASATQISCNVGTLLPGETANVDLQLRARLDALPRPKHHIVTEVEHDGFDVAVEIESEAIVDVVWLDIDGDDLPDVWELFYTGGLGGDSLLDADRDGLTAYEEYLAGSDPHLTDTDGDGKTDKEEYEQHFTNPASADSDDDSLPDAWEIDNGINPLWSNSGDDSDDDGLTNAEEFALGTKPTVADTDEDKHLDGSDNCPLHANTRQRDFDADAVGQACDPFSVVALETIPDLGGPQGGDGLAMLRSSRLANGDYENRIEIFNGRTGGEISEYSPVDGEQAALALSGVPGSSGRLLAVASERHSDRWPSITVVDTMNGAVHLRVNSLPFGSRFEAMQPLPATPTSAQQSFAVLLEDATTGAHEVHTVGVVNGASSLLASMAPAADPGWTRAGFGALLSDGEQAVAMFVAGSAADGVVSQVQVNKVADGALLVAIQPEPAGYEAVEMQVVPDVVGDATDDVAVRLRDLADGHEIIRIINLPGGDEIATIPVLDAGAAESVYGFSALHTGSDSVLALFVVSGGELTVSVRDILTGNEIYDMPYSRRPSSYRNSHSLLRNFGGGATNELAAVLENTATGQHVIEVRDIETGEVLAEAATVPKRKGTGALAYWTLLLLILTAGGQAARRRRFTKA